MSEAYDIYLKNHISNVRKSFDWLKDHNIITLDQYKEASYTILNHDSSKRYPDEYSAYDEWFYGDKEKVDILDDFNRAWLNHIHRNPHHWQHWILINDDDGVNAPIKMDEKYAIEMICDWWSFSWANDNLYGIFDWYKKHYNLMILHPETRKFVEDILDKIYITLDREGY